MAESTAVTVHKGSATREQNDRIFLEYCSMAGKRPDEEIMRHLANLYHRSVRQVENIVAHRAGASSMQTLRFSQATLLQSLVAFREQVDEAVAYYDDELDKLTVLEDQGEKFVDVEETKFSGSKDQSTTTKAVSITDARTKLYELRDKAQERFYQVVSKLQPKVHIIQGSGDGLAHQSMEEIQAQITMLEKKRLTGISQNENQSSPN